jgi:hypothetical protein
MGDQDFGGRSPQRVADKVTVHRSEKEGAKIIAHLGTIIACPYRECKQLRDVLVPINLNLRECGSMTLNGLRNSTVSTVQLHRPLDLEGGRICRISRYAN